MIRVCQYAFLPFLLSLSLHAQDQFFKFPPLEPTPPLYGYKRPFREILKDTQVLQDFDIQETKYLAEKKAESTCSVEFEGIPLDVLQYLENPGVGIEKTPILLAANLKTHLENSFERLIKKHINILKLPGFLASSAKFMQQVVTTLPSYKDKTTITFNLNSNNYALYVRLINKNFRICLATGNRVLSSIKETLNNFSPTQQFNLLFLGQLNMLEKLYNLSYYNTILGVCILSKNNFNTFLQLNEAGILIDEEPVFQGFGISLKHSSPEPFHPYSFSLIKETEGKNTPIPLILNGRLIFCEVSRQFPCFALTVNDAESIGINIDKETNSPEIEYILKNIQIGKIPLESVKVVIKKELSTSVLGTNILQLLNAKIENNTLTIG